MSQSDPQNVVRVIAQNHDNRPDALIEMLHDVQQQIGCVDDAAVQQLADAINRSRAEVHGVRSFYTDFSTSRKGRCVVRLCRAESCQAAGGEMIAAELESALGTRTGETSANGAVTVEAAYCLGNCALSPAAMVDGRLIGRVDIATLLSAIEGPDNA